MFINPYKNRNRVLLILEVIITLFTTIFTIISMTGIIALHLSWFFLFMSIIFLIRAIDTKDKKNIINVAIFLVSSLILFLN